MLGVVIAIRRREVAARANRRGHSRSFAAADAAERREGWAEVWRHRRVWGPDVCFAGCDFVRVRPPRAAAFDDDNLQAGFKSLRDGVCDGFKVRDDPGTGLRFAYRDEAARGDWWGVVLVLWFFRQGRLL